MHFILCTPLYPPPFKGPESAKPGIRAPTTNIHPIYPAISTHGGILYLRRTKNCRDQWPTYSPFFPRPLSSLPPLGFSLTCSLAHLLTIAFYNPVRCCLLYHLSRLLHLNSRYQKHEKNTLSVMASSKPTIVLIPGAWHTPAHYEDLLSLLEKAGYETKAIQLPSVDSSNPNEQSVIGDVQAIHEKLLLPLLDAGKDILLVMHSYGGCPGGAAAKNLSKGIRTTGGGIVGLVFIAAFLGSENTSLLSSLPGGKFDPWVLINVRTHLWAGQDYLS